MVQLEARMFRDASYKRRIALDLTENLQRCRIDFPVLGSIHYVMNHRITGAHLFWASLWYLVSGCGIWNRIPFNDIAITQTLSGMALCVFRTFKELRLLCAWAVQV